MKTYKSNIVNMNTGEWLGSLEQPRPCLGKDYVDNVIRSMFFESCRLGIDGNSISATIVCGYNVVCYLLIESFMTGSSVYADLYLTRGHGDPLHHIRRMTIAD